MPSLNDQTAIPPNLHTTVPAGLLADRYIVIVFEIEKSTAGGSFEYPAGFLSFLANTQLDSCEGSDQNGSYTDSQAARWEVGRPNRFFDRFMRS